jgi:hypothetical protein
LGRVQGYLTARLARTGPPAARVPGRSIGRGHEIETVQVLQRLAGWRLAMLFTLFTVAGALLIVSVMDLLLMGRSRPITC